MPRGFVNKRDRFKWDNFHYPEGETKVPGGDVIVDPEQGTTLNDSLESIGEDLTALDDRLSVLEQEFGNTGEVVRITEGADAAPGSRVSITITEEAPAANAKKGRSKK